MVTNPWQQQGKCRNSTICIRAHVLPLSEIVTCSMHTYHVLELESIHVASYYRKCGDKTSCQWADVHS